jgi:2-oxoacid:acceptor oxidoreductase gamma subunit (pyruvate/2-ketoisovalerate family)
MTEIRIHGRGGQGGVTLAKIIATTRFLKGDSVQAFGIYAAERTGAPLQAFCRFDTEPIVNRNLIYEPDHVIVLDPTLVSPGLVAGLKTGGWILINTSEAVAPFEGYRLAVVDATSIAREHHLGTRSVPIVNTALAGATARVLGMPLEDVLAALKHLKFVGGNLDAAREAFERVQLDVKPLPHGRGSVGNGRGTVLPQRPVVATARVPGLIDGNTGARPAIQTGQWATQQPRRAEHVPPCNHVCPAGNNVQGFLHALAKDNADEALGILLETTPFPSICGRVCPAPCMDQCNRIALDGSVNVCDLERFAGDRGCAEVTRRDTRDERVAVIGSGPAGLSASYHLARLGYRVTIIEAGAELGGLLRTGIPPYRLPRDVLDREIERILSLGVETCLERRIQRSDLIALAGKHDAVLVATGLQEMRGLELGGNGQTIIQGIDFLDRTNAGEMRVDGEDIIVVGGGNTAFDAARSALRVGARRVQLVYRRTREEMPAIREEIDEAIEEGVRVHYLVTPVRIRPDGERFLLTCRRMELGEPDESGRRRPVEMQGYDFDLPCHRVILALGQSPDLSVFPEGTELRDKGRLVGILEKPLYAIGDLATNDGTVAAAIGNGRRAAMHLHQVFSGESLFPAAHTEDDVVRTDAMRLHLFERREPQARSSLEARRRRWTFDEVHEGLSSADEAKRCLSCGVCNECDRCVTFCPDGVLKRVGHEFVFDYAYCKGCGVCAAECPRHVVFMSQL